MPGWYLTHMDGRIMYVIAWNLLFNKQRQAEQHTGLSFIWNTSINHAGRGSWGKKLRFLCAWSSARQRVGHTLPAPCTSLPPAGLFHCQQHTDCPALTTRSAGTGATKPRDKSKKSLLCGAEAGVSTFYWCAPGEPDQA